MARVTVEDCILNVPNRFELVLLAAKRAREIAAGSSLTVSRNNDKNPVVSLREISENTISIEGLRAGVIKGMQKTVFVDDVESVLDEELQDVMKAEQGWNPGEFNPKEFSITDGDEDGIEEDEDEDEEDADSEASEEEI